MRGLRREVTTALARRRDPDAWPLAQRAKNHLLYALVRLAIGGARLLPPRRARSAGRSLGRAAYLLFPSARRLAFANAARALADLDEGERRLLVRRAYVELGGYLGDAVASLLRPDVEVEPLPFPEESRATLARARDEGRGVLFVSAHLGPWERVAATLVAHGFPLVTIARESYDPRLTSLYDRLRGARGVRSIYRGAPGAGLRMLRTLREGGVLGAPMDLRSSVPSIDVPFLGVDASTPVGPARLALASGAAVVVGTAAPPLEEPALTTRRVVLSGTDDERSLTARINEELSGRIRALPEAWVWMHDRFRR